jgi:hypothetical protein
MALYGMFYEKLIRLARTRKAAGSGLGGRDVSLSGLEYKPREERPEVPGAGRRLEFPDFVD